MWYSYFNDKMILTANRQITHLTICLLTCDVSNNKHTNTFNGDIQSNLGHMPSVYESNWCNMLTSQLTLAVPQLTSVMSVWNLSEYCRSV